MIEHQGRKRILIVDRHALAREHLPKLWRDNLVRPILNNFAFKRFEFNSLARECFDQRNFVAVNQIVAFSSVTAVLCLFNVDNEVTGQFLGRTVSFARESQLHSCRHAWLNLDLLPHDFVFDGSCVPQQHLPLKFEFFGRAVVELFQGALAGDVQVCLVSLASFRDGLLVRVTLYLLNHLDLVPGGVQSDRMRILRPKEHLENLKRVSVEGVTLNLA